MIRKRIKATAAAVAMAAAAAGGAVALAAAPAHATGWNINGWSESACSNRYGDNYCLWYSPGGGGGGWGSTARESDLDYGQTFNIGGGAGLGAGVWRDAASMSNGTSNCHVAVWTGIGETGDVDWLNAGYGGNLTSALRNQNESIDYDTCS
jgi:hypothetical protein